MGDDGGGEALVGDGEHALDEIGVLRVAKGGELEEGVDGAEPSVAGACRVPPLGFKMVEEPSDGDGVDVGEVEPRRRLAGRVGDVGE